MGFTSLRERKASCDASGQVAKAMVARCGGECIGCSYCREGNQCTLRSLHNRCNSTQHPAHSHSILYILHLVQALYISHILHTPAHLVQSMNSRGTVHAILAGCVILRKQSPATNKNQQTKKTKHPGNSVFLVLCLYGFVCFFPGGENWENGKHSA